MNIHVLPGDSLVERFAETGIEGEVIVCRECLIDGSVNADNLPAFWNARAEFIEAAFDASREKYFQNVVSELEKLNSISPDAQVNLWFEHELFCQANMWFCLWLVRETSARVFRVAPIVKAEKGVWKGFGSSDSEDLQRSFDERIEFKKADLMLGADLWRAFQNSENSELERLLQTKSACFPYLEAVCRAAAEKNSRPKEILRDITNDKEISRGVEIFEEFSRRAGVYGFGDAQARRILREI